MPAAAAALWLAPGALMLGADLVWVSVAQPRYAALVRGVQHSALRVNLVAAVAAYALMLVGLYAFVVPGVVRAAAAGRAGWWPRVRAALRHGALFGAVLYGVFNATNLAMFTAYAPATALIDTAWGTSLFFAVGLVAAAALA